jgi:predicted transposase YdaD
MLLAEYDYDTDIAVQRREAFDDGVAIGEKVGEERGISIGLSQGAHQKAIETAKSMKIENMSISMISHFTGLSPEEIEKL